MRGKVKCHVIAGKFFGITPAYAGKRFFENLLLNFFEDHPRVCGEKEEEDNGQITNLGSPPRMRGKASTLKTSRRFPGITPAYAGKSYQYPNPVQHKQDHPRVCGEKFGCRCPLDSQRGSPPRMRGKASAGNAVESITGITPAYAGKSGSFPGC